MLETYLVTFSGPIHQGLPNPYHSYAIFASQCPALGAQASIATVVPLTNGPMPPQQHFVASHGTNGTAATMAGNALAALPGNQGLHRCDVDP